MADETTTTTTTDSSTAVTPVQPLKPVTQPVTDPGTFTPEQQERVNALMGNTRKEASAASLSALAKELGYESVDDMKAAAKEAKARQEKDMSELEKATKRADEAEKKAAEKDALIAQVKAEQLADKVDNKLRSLVKGVNEKVATVDDVVDWLRLKKKADVEKLANEDGTIDEKAAEKLVADFKKEKSAWFAVSGGVGSPSVSGGRSLEPDSADRKRAQAHSQRTLRG